MQAILSKKFDFSDFFCYNPYMMSIQELKAYLKRHKITYEELSIKSGVAIGTIRDIMRGATQSPRIDTMQAIYKALGLYEGREVQRVSKELADKYERLSEEQKAKVIGYLDAMLERANGDKG